MRELEQKKRNGGGLRNGCVIYLKNDNKSINQKEKDAKIYFSESIALEGEMKR